MTSGGKKDNFRPSGPTVNGSVWKKTKWTLCSASYCEFWAE